MEVPCVRSAHAAQTCQRPGQMAGGRTKSGQWKSTVTSLICNCRVTCWTVAHPPPISVFTSALRTSLPTHWDSMWVRSLQPGVSETAATNATLQALAYPMELYKPSQPLSAGRWGFLPWERWVGTRQMHIHNYTFLRN